MQPELMEIGEGRREGGATRTATTSRLRPEVALPPPTEAVVTALATTPVKGLRIAARSELMLTRTGVRDNRRFFLLDEDDQMVNGKRLGTLAAVCADYDPDSSRLTMSFPDGVTVADTVRLGAAIETRFFSRTATARLVAGPWAELLSRHTGTALRLVEAAPDEGGVDRGAAGAVSLISQASVAALAARAGRPVDARRFRMLIEVAGVAAHAEDGWVGATIEIGAARVAVGGHVGRCLVTTQCPDTGVPDLPTLKLLAYRKRLETTERLAFGVFGAVRELGLVRVGDRVLLAPAS